MNELTALNLDSITRTISTWRGESVSQVLSTVHRGGSQYDITVEFWGERGSTAYHVERMPGLGWQVIGLA